MPQPPPETVEVRTGYPVAPMIDMNKTTIPRLLLPLAILCGLGGCASTSLEIGVTTRAETYYEIKDRYAILDSEKPRTAATPTVMTGTSPGRGIAADLAFDKALATDYRPFSLPFSPTEEQKPFTVIRNDAMVNRCIAAGKVQALQGLMSSMQPGNIVDSKHASEIGRLLDVEFLLVPQISYLSTDNAGRFSFTGLTFIRTGWITVEGTLQLWHAPSGQLVWQSTGESTLTAENVVGISPPTQAAFDALFTTLVGDFITGRDGSVVSSTISAPRSANPTNSATTDDSPSPGTTQNRPSNTTGADTATTPKATTVEAPEADDEDPAGTGTSKRPPTEARETPESPGALEDPEVP